MKRRFSERLLRLEKYRVATPRDLRESLAKFSDTGLRCQINVFNKAEVGNTNKVRGWFLQHCAQFAKCVAPGCVGGPPWSQFPASHFPAEVEMPETMLLDSSGDSSGV